MNINGQSTSDAKEVYPIQHESEPSERTDLRDSAFGLKVGTGNTDYRRRGKMFRVSEDGSRRREEFIATHRHLCASLNDLQDAADQIFDTISLRVTALLEFCFCCSIQHGSVIPPFHSSLFRVCLRVKNFCSSGVLPRSRKSVTS